MKGEQGIPCNLCEKSFRAILKKNSEVEGGKKLATNEFLKTRDKADCLNYYTCMPLIRHGGKH